MILGYVWLWLIGQIGIGPNALWPRVSAVVIALCLAIATVYLNHSFILRPASLPVQTGAISGFVFLIVASVVLHAAFVLKQPVFPMDSTGILVLRLFNDADDRLQYRLIGSLDHRLAGAAANDIQVYANRSFVDEGAGLTAGHAKAREIGRMFNAKLVIWGRKIDERRFYPRVTVVDVPESHSFSQQTYDVQNISELELPPQLVDEPISLAHFASAVSYARSGDTAAALRSFDAAFVGAPANEIADIRSFAGYVALIGSIREPVADSRFLDRAIEILEVAKGLYREDERLKLASVQSDLGLAYGLRQTGIRSEDLYRAISEISAALQVFTEDGFPDQWARAQTNLGMAYGELRAGDRKRNLRAAMASFQAALRVRKQEKFPAIWALIQSDLGLAHRQYGEAMGGEHLEVELAKSLRCFRDAATVQTKEKYPLKWADIQVSLGNVYSTFEPPKTAEALAFYNAALEIVTHENSPMRWALIQANLASACLLAALNADRSQIFDQGIGASENALKVFSQDKTPGFWARAEVQLGRCILGKALLLNEWAPERASLARKAIACAEIASSVLTKEENPFDWAMKEDLMARAYASIVNIDLYNFVDARKHIDAALEICTENSYPKEYSRLINLRQALRRWISGRDLSGSYIDPPQTSPMNRSGRMEWIIDQLQTISQKMGLRGTVQAFFIADRYSLSYDVPQEYAGIQTSFDSKKS
jgi:tetratricopeptide (TPR) repeat protein